MKKEISKKNIYIIYIIMILLACFSFFRFLIFIKNNYDIYGSNAISNISNYSSWWYILTKDFFMMFLYLSPIIISYAFVSNFLNVYHSGYFLNIVQRVGYKKAFLMEMIKCWKGSFLLPFISGFILFISSLKYTNTTILKWEMTDGIQFLQVSDTFFSVNIFIFILLHLLLLALFSFFIINVSIIITKYVKKNYFMSLLTLIIVIFIETIGVFIVGPLVAKITGIIRAANVFSLYNLIVLDAVPNLLWEFAYIIFLCVISTILIYRLFYLRIEEDI